MAEPIQLAHKQKRKGTRLTRQSTRIDLTPMVDLGFLLITFFVFTTTMAQARSLGMTEPTDGKTMPVKESGAMTIILDSSHQIYYYHGLLDITERSMQIKTANFKSIRAIIMAKKSNTDAQKLMFIIKSRNSASYGDNIDILDEMSICAIPSGHYVEGDLDAREDMFLRVLRNKYAESQMP